MSLIRVLIVYDSLYGNTEKVAKAIGGALIGEVKVVRVSEANPAEIKALDLFIVGSPTQGGNATKAMQAFLDKIPADSIKGMKVATFDTRLTSKFVKIFGYAADRMTKVLKSKGAISIMPPEGFFVIDREGPLQERELERATAWAKKLVETRN